MCGLCSIVLIRIESVNLCGLVNQFGLQTDCNMLNKCFFLKQKTGVNAGFASYCMLFKICTNG